MPRTKHSKVRLRHKKPLLTLAEATETGLQETPTFLEALDTLREAVDFVSKRLDHSSVQPVISWLSGSKVPSCHPKSLQSSLKGECRALKSKLFYLIQERSEGVEGILSPRVDFTSQTVATGTDRRKGGSSGTETTSVRAKVRRFVKPFMTRLGQGAGEYLEL